MKAIRLRTEYLKEPLGLGNPTPKFYWNCEGGLKQTAWQIICKKDNTVVWDSGKVLSNSMTHILYNGEPFHSRERITWSVRLWDERDFAGEWAESWFELGLLDKTDWKAAWITGDYKPVKNTRYPVDCFRKVFTCGTKIAKARFYASARGIYDVTINGHRIEDFILAPGMTDYRERIQYQTYDVAEYLQQENTVELRLADGWYRGSCAAYGVTNVYGTQTSVMAQLELSYEDGTMQTICTDESWAWCNDGSIRFADLKDGEIYNAQMKPSYCGRARTIKGDVNLVASDNVPVREKERFAAKLLPNRVLDFGQNIAGYLEFTVKGQPGQVIRLVCGEVLDQDGNVDLSGIQETRPAKGWSQMDLIKKLMTNQISGENDPTPWQEIRFTCSGGVDHYKTSFAIFGFRYVQVVTKTEINPADFTAIAVYSDMEQTGDFHCSNELVNKLYRNTLWSMKGNFLELPTDCPTRERLGWTGDAQIFFNTGAYLMDTAAFFRKWMVDMLDAQKKNGLLPAVLPYQGVSMMYDATGSSVGWADAVYLIPYRYYQRNGDRRVLEETWPMVEKYANYLMNHLGMTDRKAGKANPYNKYTYEKGVHLGEWLEPEEFRDQVYGTQAKHPEECTAYLYYAMVTIGEIARILGKREMASRCEEIAKGAKEAYDTLFVKTGTLNTNRQAKLVRPLALGLLDGEEKRNAQKHLVKAVKDYNYCVGTGFLSTPFILPVLTEAGELEAAYKMLENTRKPGWLGEVLDGATTIWENWEGDLSQNHYSPGAVCQWLFDSVAGIRVAGENRFRIVPLPGGTLTHAKANYRSPYGLVESGWEKNDNGIKYVVTIPANCTAEVILPGGERRILSAGRYEMEEANV